MTVKDPAAIKRDLFVSGFGAILTSLCGWLLWGSPLGDAWVNASYDYLFRFSTRGVTNEVVLILMDNEAYDHFHQNRGQPWSRMLHAELLRKLAADGSALVVLDTFLRQPRSAEEDQALAEALKEQRAVALMAEQARVTHITLAGARATLPCEPFLSAAGGHWGVAWLDPDLDGVVRRHWPFPAPGPYPSLPRTAALLAGAPPGGGEGERWLRYYGQNGAWLELSYRFALASPKEFFRDKIVFIGCRPKTTVADGEPDEFATPYTRWTGENVGGVEIQIVAFLNLMNGDWLRRPAAWVEACLLLVSGLAFGAGLCQLRRGAACVLGLTGGLLVMVGAAWWSHQTNYWFPWLVVSGGEVPLALGWALLRLGQGGESIGIQKKAAVGNTPADVTGGVTKHAEVDVPPETPDYELVNPPFGHGAYGKVWLVRNAVGEWQALKAVYRAKFDDAGPYEREFSGIKRYKPISDKHPGLLRVDFVSRKRPESFYYVMELGDPLLPGWERDPSTYRPRDLASERGRRPGRRLPINECVRIGVALARALVFLHQRGLTHRDIKPQNIIFVAGQPKLADVGLISEIDAQGGTGTYVGTPGYLPPPPEHPGTPQADVYALGMVLYVLCTGRSPGAFPEISATLAGGANSTHFLALNAVILRACQPERSERYAAASELLRDLERLQATMAD